VSSRSGCAARMGENFNPAMMETTEARKAVLENLVNQRLLALDASKMRLAVSDQRCP
jgi:peptidyl-prolyl cis-trans isomerase D